MTVRHFYILYRNRTCVGVHSLIIVLYLSVLILWHDDGME